MSFVMDNGVIATGDSPVQAVVDLIAALLALLATAAMSHLGVALETRGEPQREIHRLSNDCTTPSVQPTVFLASRPADC